jgi:hypothetical protein
MAWRTNVLWAVNANWNSDGLNVEANSLDNPNDWNADNRFLSRNSIFSPLRITVVGFLSAGLFSIRPPFARFLQYLSRVR